MLFVYLFPTFSSFENKLKVLSSKQNKNEYLHPPIYRKGNKMPKYFCVWKNPQKCFLWVKNLTFPKIQQENVPFILFKNFIRKLLINKRDIRKNLLNFLLNQINQNPLSANFKSINPLSANSKSIIPLSANFNPLINKFKFATRIQF